MISYAVGIPNSVKAFGLFACDARFANRPNRYSVFSSWPSNVRVMSTRPWTSGARRDELIDFACASIVHKPQSYIIDHAFNDPLTIILLTCTILFGETKLSRNFFCSWNNCSKVNCGVATEGTLRGSLGRPAPRLDPEIPGGNADAWVVLIARNAARAEIVNFILPQTISSTSF